MCVALDDAGDGVARVDADDRRVATELGLTSSQDATPPEGAAAPPHSTPLEHRLDDVPIAGTVPAGLKLGKKKSVCRRCGRRRGHLKVVLRDPSLDALYQVVPVQPSVAWWRRARVRLDVQRLSAGTRVKLHARTSSRG